MFVRWQRRPARKNRAYEQRLSAVLVRAERADGKPRQRIVIVKYLGMIREYFIVPTAITNPYVQHQARLELVWFWNTVDTALAGLDLDDETRSSIAAMVATRVPRLTDAEAADCPADVR